MGVFNDNPPAICINNMHVGTLKQYLSEFPDDARVVIMREYDRRDLQIAINFEHQKEVNEVQFLIGMPASTYEGVPVKDSREVLNELADKKNATMEKWNEGGRD